MFLRVFALVVLSGVKAAADCDSFPGDLHDEYWDDISDCDGKTAAGATCTISGKTGHTCEEAGCTEAGVWEGGGCAPITCDLSSIVSSAQFNDYDLGTCPASPPMGFGTRCKLEGKTANTPCKTVQCADGAYNGVVLTACPLCDVPTTHQTNAADLGSCEDNPDGIEAGTTCKEKANDNFVCADSVCGLEGTLVAGACTACPNGGTSTGGGACVGMCQLFSDDITTCNTVITNADGQRFVPAGTTCTVKVANSVCSDIACPDGGGDTTGNECTPCPGGQTNVDGGTCSVLTEFVAAFDGEGVPAPAGCTSEGNLDGVTYMTCSTTNGQPLDTWNTQPCTRVPQEDCPDPTAAVTTVTATTTTETTTTKLTDPPDDDIWADTECVGHTGAQEPPRCHKVVWNRAMKSGSTDVWADWQHGFAAPEAIQPGDILEWSDVPGLDASNHPVRPVWPGDGQDSTRVMKNYLGSNPLGSDARPDAQGDEYFTGWEEWDGSTIHKHATKDVYRWKAPNIGHYAFYCPNHPDDMQGFAVVTPQNRQRRAEPSGCADTYVNLCTPLTPKTSGVNALYFHDLACSFADAEVTITSGDVEWTLDPLETVTYLKTIYSAEDDFTVECADKIIVVQARLKDWSAPAINTDKVYVAMYSGFKAVTATARARRATTIKKKYSKTAQKASSSKTKPTSTPIKQAPSGGGGGGGSSNNTVGMIGAVIAGVVLVGLAVAVIIWYNSDAQKAKRAANTRPGWQTTLNMHQRL
jgi:hypothetical protein